MGFLRGSTRKKCSCRQIVTYRRVSGGIFDAIFSYFSDGLLVLLSDFREAEVEDDGALEIIKNLQINWLKSEAFDKTEVWEKEVWKLADQVDAIYLHIDADILNHIHVPNAACMAKGGPSIHTLMHNIRIIMETGKVLVYGSYGFYFDTNISGQDSLTLSGLRSVSAGLEGWKEMPNII